MVLTSDLMVLSLILDIDMSRHTHTHICGLGELRSVRSGSMESLYEPRVPREQQLDLSGCTSLAVSKRVERV